MFWTSETDLQKSNLFFEIKRFYKIYSFILKLESFNFKLLSFTFKEKTLKFNSLPFLNFKNKFKVSKLMFSFYRLKFQRLIMKSEIQRKMFEKVRNIQWVSYTFLYFLNFTRKD